MAKCLRIVGQGVPCRMSDDDAFQIVVRDGDGEYCPKKFWRAWYAPNPDFPDKEVKTPFIARLVPDGTGRRDKISETRTLARQDQHARQR